MTIGLLALAPREPFLLSRRSGPGAVVCLNRRPVWHTRHCRGDPADPYLGVAIIALLVVGQMPMSLARDHFGGLGLPVQAFGAPRLGRALLFVVVLICAPDRRAKAPAKRCGRRDKW